MAIIKRSLFRGNAGKCVLSILLCCVFSVTGQNSLTLNINQAQHTINRALYGALFENWGRDVYGGLYVGESSSVPNTNGMRNDVVQAFIEADGVLKSERLIIAQ